MLLRRSSRPARGGIASRTPLPTQVAAAVTGLGAAVIVGHDGEPGWQGLRVAVVALISVAAWRAAGRRPLVRAPVLLAVGLVAVPVGIGIALPFLAKTGLSARSVAGAAVLAGGAVLVGAGVRDVLHLGRRRTTFPAVALLLAALAVMAWTLGQAVAATNVPRTQVGDRTPADAGVEHRDVAFPAADGVQLSGWYVPSRNGAAVVVLHGAGSTRSGALEQSVVLARAGYGVLLFDARGHGRSDGRAMDLGWYGDADLGGAVAFVRQQPDVSPGRVGALGLSMGGEIAVGGSAVEGVAGIVAEGATGRVADDQAWLSDEHGWRGALTERVAALTTRFTDLLTDASPPVALRDAVAAAPDRPVLLIAGGAVEEEPLAAAHIASGAADAVEIWVAPGSGHTDALATHPDEWSHRVVAFFDAALGPGRDVPPDAG